MIQVKSANTIIYCENWEKTRTFYSESLGLETRFKREDWFIEYIITDTACLSIADASKCTIKPSHGDGITLSFYVDNLNVLFDQFKEGQLNPTEIKAYSWRAPYFYIHDPENTRIEFWAVSN